MCKKKRYRTEQDTQSGDFKKIRINEIQYISEGISPRKETQELVYSKSREGRVIFMGSNVFIYIRGGGSLQSSHLIAFVFSVK